MKKIITPINDTQLAQWITTLESAGVEYKQVLNTEGKPGLLLNEGDAETYLNIRKLNTAEEQFKNFFSRFSQQRPAATKENKGCMPSWTSILGLFVALVVLGKLSDCGGSDSASYESEPAPKKEMTLQDSIELQFSAWDGSHRGMEKAIKAQMKNPDSYDHVETQYKIIGEGNENGVRALYVVTTFRGTNSFNAVITQQAKGMFTISGDLLSMGIE